MRRPQKHEERHDGLALSLREVAILFSFPVELVWLAIVFTAVMAAMLAAVPD
jgi:hypothetical protein